MSEQSFLPAPIQTSSRRHFMKKCGLAAVAAAAPAQAAGWTPSLCVTDVDFVLANFKRQAGLLIKTKEIYWDGVESEFKRLAKDVSSEKDHLLLCRRLVARLQDGSATFEPSNPLLLPTTLMAQANPGVFLCASDSNLGKVMKLYIRFAVTEARTQGALPGIQVERIDRVGAQAWLDNRMAQLKEETGWSTKQQLVYGVHHWGLNGPDQSQIEFDVMSSGSQRRNFRLTRSIKHPTTPFGCVFPPATSQAKGSISYAITIGKNAYIHFRTLSTAAINHLDAIMEANGHVAGYILDFRGCGSGYVDNDSFMGRFVDTGATWKHYKSTGKRPFGGGVAVLIDAGTKSGAETLVGQFKEDGRALIIGESSSAGAASQKTTISAPSQLFKVTFGVATQKGRFNEGKGLEGVGVSPHELKFYHPTDLLTEKDTLISLADDKLRHGFNPEVVPYTPPN